MLLINKVSADEDEFATLYVVSDRMSKGDVVSISFLVLPKKNTQNAAKGVYEFVPLQDFSKPWTDEELYKKYGLTDEEIQFIESMIRPSNHGTVP